MNRLKAMESVLGLFAENASKPLIDKCNSQQELINELTENLKEINTVANSAPDKERDDITMSDVFLMDDALQKVFEISAKSLTKAKGGE